MKEKSLNRIAHGVCEVLCLSLMALIAPLFVAIDVLLISDEVSEISLTEFTQEGLLLISAFIFWRSAFRHEQSRGFSILVAGLFSCMAVRELDGILDHIWHGFWFWPAITIAIGSIVYVFFVCRDTIIESMADFIDTKPYFHIVFGLIAILFSRVFGSGSLLWKHILDSDEYSQTLKSSLQEGLELYGYVFIAYGSFLYIRYSRRRYNETRVSGGDSV